MIVTYIIRTGSDEYYCGVSDKLPLTLRQHHLEKYPYWFHLNRRKVFKDIIFFRGDHAAQIRSFGVKRFYLMTCSFKRYPFMNAP